MAARISDIIGNVSKIFNTNDNVNNNDKYAKSKKVDEIADKLVEKLANPGARRFYCLVAYKLPEHIIWDNLDLALTYKGERKDYNPQRYFTWLCKRTMQ